MNNKTEELIYPIDYKVEEELGYLRRLLKDLDGILSGSIEKTHEIINQAQKFYKGNCDSDSLLIDETYQTIVKDLYDIIREFVDKVYEKVSADNPTAWKNRVLTHFNLED